MGLVFVFGLGIATAAAFGLVWSIKMLNWPPTITYLWALPLLIICIVLLIGSMYLCLSMVAPRFISNIELFWLPRYKLADDAHSQLKEIEKPPLKLLGKTDKKTFDCKTEETYLAETSPHQVVNQYEDVKKHRAFAIHCTKEKQYLLSTFSKDRVLHIELWKKSPGNEAMDKRIFPELTKAGDILDGPVHYRWLREAVAVDANTWIISLEKYGTAGWYVYLYRPLQQQLIPISATHVASRRVDGDFHDMEVFGMEDDDVFVIYYTKPLNYDAAFSAMGRSLEGLSHVVRVSRKDGSVQEVFRISLKLGRIIGFNRKGDTLFLQTLDDRKPESKITRNWSLKLK